MEEPPKQPIGALDPPPSSADPTVIIHSNNLKKKIVLIGFIIILALAGIFFYLKSNKLFKQTSSSVNSDTNSVFASVASDFSAVCTGKKISNAKDNNYAPHTFALFKQNYNIKDSYSASSIQLQSSIPTASTADVQATQTVGCLSHVSETDTGRVCTYKDLKNKTVKLKQFNVLYELIIYEAKTGKKLVDQELNGQASSCPTFTDYEVEDQKLFVPPNSSELTDTILKGIVK